MFKVVDMGSIEERKCFALSGDQELSGYLAGEMDAVQRAGAAGLPTCDVLVSQESQTPDLLARMRAPQRRGPERCLHKDLSFALWRKAIAGNFDFLVSDLQRTALDLLVDAPDFYRERVVRPGEFRLYVLTDAVRAAVRDCLAARALPEKEVLCAEDLCLLLRCQNGDAVLSAVSDAREALLGTYAQECLFSAENTPDSVVWRLMNEWSADACGADLAAAILRVRGDALCAK